jgi:hypothetical protein
MPFLPTISICIGGILRRAIGVSDHTRLLPLSSLMDELVPLLPRAAATKREMLKAMRARKTKRMMMMMAMT